MQLGAATLLVATVAHTGGHHLDDGREAYTVGNDADLFTHSHGVDQWALDPDPARTSWTTSQGLLDRA